MAPDWLSVLAWISLAAALVCAAAIAYDIVVNRRRQPMGVMNLVYPITAVYFGPVALVFYWRWARAQPVGATTSMTSMGPMSMAMSMPSSMPMPTSMDEGMSHLSHEHAAMAAEPDRPERPRWVTLATEASHCGSGCTLGDVISEFVIFGLGLSIAGVALWSEYIGDYALAVVFGVAFQYFAIAPMRGLGVKDGLKAAIKADIISLSAFEVGLFGWMALMAFVFFPAPHHLRPDSVAYWLLMQVGMIIGFFTSLPANVWLVRRGIKVPM